MVGLGQSVLAVPDLDGDLPVGRRADLDIVCRVFDGRLRRGTQLRVVENEPEEGMGVEQEPHPMYSWKSLRCSSSSETMVSMPLALPGFRGWRFAFCSRSS